MYQKTARYDEQKNTKIKCQSSVDRAFHREIFVSTASRSSRWFSWQPRNLLKLGREFESRCGFTNWDFPHKKKKKRPTSEELLIRIHKIRLHDRRAKGTTTAESFSREKLRQAPQKEGGEILCDPGWYVHNKPDVQNKWDDNTHTHWRVFPNIINKIMYDVF